MQIGLTEQNFSQSWVKKLPLWQSVKSHYIFTINFEPTLAKKNVPLGQFSLL